MSILKKISERFGQIAVLIDPEKTNTLQQLYPIIKKAESINIDYFFIGGSTVTISDFEQTIQLLRKHTHIPVVIFPGSNQQISCRADALLYLSLVSGRNPDFLISHHVNSALEVYNLGIEVIPTGYLLVDGFTKSSVAYVSQTTPIPRESTTIAVRTALAAELQGKKVIYFDAGSGALVSVPEDFVRYLRSWSKIPIIVGGGIKNIEQFYTYLKLKVNVIVVGNKIEENSDFLLDIYEYINNRQKV